MPPEQTQPTMTGDESAAALAFATQLQQQLIPKQAPQEAEMAQGEEMMDESQNMADPRVDELETQFKDFKKEVQKMVKDEIGGLKDMIKEALNEEDESTKDTE